VELLFAWLGNFRRLVVRYERAAENYLGFVRLVCMVPLLRYFQVFVRWLLGLLRRGGSGRKDLAENSDGRNAAAIAPNKHAHSASSIASASPPSPPRR
jgi:hypothetical protein